MSIDNYRRILDQYENLIYKIIGKYPHEYAEDLYQESCIALWIASKSWKDGRGCSLMTWIYKHVFNACSRYMKNKSSSIRIPAHLYSEVKIDYVSLDAEIFNGKSTAEFLDLKIDSDPIDETHEMIFKALRYLEWKRVLSSEDVSIITYFCFENMTYKQLAEIFEVDTSTMYRRLRKIILRMRPYFLRHCS